MNKNKSKKRKKPKAIINQNHPVEVPHLDRDDLTLIEGILPQTEVALNSIGVRKYADFKDYTSESLAKLLQQRAGIDIPLESIEKQKWIESALVLADNFHNEKNSVKISENFQTEKGESRDEKPDISSPDGKKVTQANQGKELEEAPLKEKSLKNISNDDGDGESLTSYKSNQKKMIDSDSQNTKQTTKQREGMATDNSIASPKLKQEHIDKFSESIKKSDMDQTELDEQKHKLMRSFEEKVSLKIIDATYTQVELPMTAKAPSQKIIHGEIQCNLTGTNAILETQYRFPLYTQIHVIDVETEQSEIIVSKTFQLIPQQDNYKIHLEFEVPKVGNYQLNAVSFLLAPEPKIDFKKGPFLRVVPEQNYVR